MFSARFAAWTTRFLAISRASCTEDAFGVLFWVEVKGPLSVEPTNGEKLARLLLGGGIGVSNTLGVIGILVGGAGWGISISISF